MIDGIIILIFIPQVKLFTDLTFVIQDITVLTSKIKCIIISGQFKIN